MATLGHPTPDYCEATHPDFADAVQRGRAFADARVVRALFDGLRILIGASLAEIAEIPRDSTLMIAVMSFSGSWYFLAACSMNC